MYSMSHYHRRGTCLWTNCQSFHSFYFHVIFPLILIHQLFSFSFWVFPSPSILVVCTLLPAALIFAYLAPYSLPPTQLLPWLDWSLVFNAIPHSNFQMHYHLVHVILMTEVFWDLETLEETVLRVLFWNPFSYFEVRLHFRVHSSSFHLAFCFSKYRPLMQQNCYGLMALAPHYFFNLLNLETSLTFLVSHRSLGFDYWNFHLVDGVSWVYSMSEVHQRISHYYLCYCC